VQAVYLKPYVVDLRRLKESSNLVLEKEFPGQRWYFLTKIPPALETDRKQGKR